jgi:hypothetical protein
MARETDLMNLMNRIESLESRVRFLSKLEGGGSGIVATASDTKTDTQSSSVSAGDSVALTGLSISHALSSSSNKILLMGQVGAVASSQNYANVGVAFAVDGTLIGIGTSVSNRTAVGAYGVAAASFNYTVQSRHINWVYEPGDTSSHTYTIHAINITSATKTIYINRSEVESDSADYGRAASSLVLLEMSL